MPVARPRLLFTLAPLLLACEQARQESAAEMLERAELQDAWLATLLPVAVAVLLLLVLVVSWRRRHGGTSLEGLFRRRSVRQGWQEASAKYARWRAEAGERVRIAEAQAAAREAEWRARQAEIDARPVPRVLSVDGRATLLEANQRILVRARRAERDGPILDITEAGLKLSGWTTGERPDIPWSEIREISVRVGSERRVWIPITLGVLCAAMLGFIGFWVDALGQSTSGNPQSAAQVWGMFIGCAVGGALGSLIMMALPGPRWRKLVDVPAGSPPLTLTTVATRAEEIAAATAAAAERTWETVDTIETSARLVLIMMLLVLVGLVAG